MNIQRMQSSPHTLRREYRPYGCRREWHRPRALAYPIVLDPPERAPRTTMHYQSMDSRALSSGGSVDGLGAYGLTPKNDRKRRRTRKKKMQDSMVLSSADQQSCTLLRCLVIKIRENIALHRAATAFSDMLRNRPRAAPNAGRVAAFQHQSLVRV